MKHGVKIPLFFIFVNLAAYLCNQPASLYAAEFFPVPFLQDRLARDRDEAIELAVIEARASCDARKRLFVKNKPDGSWNSLPTRKDIKEAEKKVGKDKKEPFHFKGYYKNLLSIGRSLTEKEYFLSDMQRFRLETRIDLSERLYAKVVYYNEIILGNYLHKEDFDLIRENDQIERAFVDLDKAYVDRRDLYMRHLLYRAFAEYRSPYFQFTIGKQLVDWGRCRFWSPMDLFNPVSPLVLEREERIGVDAVNVNFSPNAPFPELNIVYAPQHVFDRTSIGGRLYKMIGNFDTFFMGGIFKNDAAIGGGIDGQLGDWGARAELTVTWANDRDDYFRGALEAEYHFAKFDIYGEYFYNGGADDDNVDEFINSFDFANRVLSLKEHLLGIQVTYEITPLIKLHNYILGDIIGPSIFLNPEIKYNVLANLDLSGGAQFFWGGDESEFGIYEHIYYTQLQYFF